MKILPAINSQSAVYAGHVIREQKKLPFYYQKWLRKCLMNTDVIGGRARV